MSGWACRFLALSVVILPYLLLVDCSLRAMFWGALGESPSWCTAFQPGGRNSAGDIASLTPHQIVPETHMLMPYAVLRSVNFGFGPIGAKTLGMAGFYGAILAPYTLSVLVWKRLSKAQTVTFILGGGSAYVGLAVTALFAANPTNLLAGQCLTAIWFGLFLVAIPVLTRMQIQDRL